MFGADRPAFIKLIVTGAGNGAKYNAAIDANALPAPPHNCVPNVWPSRGSNPQNSFISPYVRSQKSFMFLTCGAIIGSFAADSYKALVRAPRLSPLFCNMFLAFSFFVAKSFASE